MTNMAHLTAEQQQRMMQAMAQQQQQQVHHQPPPQQMQMNLADMVSVGPKDEIPVVAAIPPPLPQQAMPNAAGLQLDPAHPGNTAAPFGATPMSIAGVTPPANHHQVPFSSAGNNTFFNDLLSPFFAPYGIDVSHFPLTNPPIFESAMMVNPQGQLRRRISISNGQIGQITNHDNDDFFSDQSPYSSDKGQDDYNVLNNSHVPTQQALLQQQQQQFQQQNIQQQQPMMMQQQQQHPLQQQQQPAVSSVPPPAATTPSSTTGTLPTNSNGVPTQKLIYNNEIIFNPEAGPIPGTAAWKKARLLERNRVAASKCRQRKKAAQNQLRDDVQKYSREIGALKNEVIFLKAMLKEAKKHAEQKGLTDLLETFEKLELQRAVDLEDDKKKKVVVVDHYEDLDDDDDL